jgi:hypothetical protein
VCLLISGIGLIGSRGAQPYARMTSCCPTGGMTHPISALAHSMTSLLWPPKSADPGPVWSSRRPRSPGLAKCQSQSRGVQVAAFVRLSAVQPSWQVITEFPPVSRTLYWIVHGAGAGPVLPSGWFSRSWNMKTAIVSLRACTLRQDGTKGFLHLYEFTGAQWKGDIHLVQPYLTKVERCRCESQSALAKEAPPSFAKRLCPAALNAARQSCCT